jgi:hypothetical protein
VTSEGESYRAQFTGSQRDFLDFLEQLETNTSFREEYEQDPLKVLRANGWELDLPPDYPNEATAPPPGQIRAARASLEAGEGTLWPWIWRMIPWVD